MELVRISTAQWQFLRFFLKQIYLGNPVPSPISDHAMQLSICGFHLEGSNP